MKDTAEQELSRQAQRFFPKGVDLAELVNKGSAAKQPTTLRTRFTFYLTYAPEDASRTARKSGLGSVEERWERFQTEEGYPILKDASDEYEHVNVYYTGDELLSYEISDTLVGDVMW